MLAGIFEARDMNDEHVLIKDGRSREYDLMAKLPLNSRGFVYFPEKGPVHSGAACLPSCGIEHDMPDDAFSHGHKRANPFFPEKQGFLDEKLIKFLAQYSAPDHAVPFRVVPDLGSIDMDYIGAHIADCGRICGRRIRSFILLEPGGSAILNGVAHRERLGYRVVWKSAAVMAEDDFRKMFSGDYGLAQYAADRERLQKWAKEGWRLQAL
jgi:hypothetical protein